MPYHKSKAKLFYELGYRYRILEKWLNSADAFEKSLDIYKRLKDYQNVSEVELALGEMIKQGVEPCINMIYVDFANSFFTSRIFILHSKSLS